jgi:hypothetical protein
MDENELETNAGCWKKKRTWKKKKEEVEKRRFTHGEMHLRNK